MNFNEFKKRSTFEKVDDVQIRVFLDNGSRNIEYFVTDIKAASYGKSPTQEVDSRAIEVYIKCEKPE